MDCLKISLHLSPKDKRENAAMLNNAPAEDPKESQPGTGDDPEENGEATMSSETEACLEKSSDRTSSVEKLKPHSKMREKLQEKCACLDLSWNGLKLLIGLAFLCSFLLIAVIVLAANLDCWGWSTRAVCQSPQCLRIGADVLERLNQSERPCRDFFHFACGEWQRKEKNGHAIASLGRFTASMENERQFRDIIRRELATSAYIQSTSEPKWKMKAFYESCMNIDAVESLQIAPLRQAIDHLYGWKVLGTSWTAGMWNFRNVLYQLHVKYGVHAFFEVSVELNNFLDDRTVITISPAGLGLPHKDFYFRDRNNRTVKAYQEVLRVAAGYFGAPPDAAGTFRDNLFNFERRLAEKHPDDRYDKHQTFQRPFTIERLRLASPAIPWLDLLRQFFPTSDIDDNSLVMGNLTYLTEMSTIISSSDSGTLNNYMMWKLVHQYSPHLSHLLRKDIDEYRHQVTGSYREKDRWDYCLEQVENVMSLAMNAMFAESQIPIQSYPNITLIFNEITQVMSKRAYYYKWMDERTRQLTEERIKSYRVDVSPPPFLNSSFMAEYYARLTIQKADFFRNILNGVQFNNYIRESWLKNASAYLGFQRHGSRKQTPFLSSSTSVMIVPLSLLARPWFNVTQPYSLNFGALGTLIARTLINAIEDSREYDRMWRHAPKRYHEINGWRYEERREDKELEGKIPHWWTNYTLFRYERHQNCVATEYYKYFMTNVEVDHYGHRLDIRINGNRTVRENMAEIGGLALSYHAFVNWQWNRGRDKFLPGLQNRTHYQMFFISYAQSHCSVERTGSILHDLYRSDFPPNKIRVNGALGHLEEFVWNFGCNYREYMNAYYKCETW